TRPRNDPPTDLYLLPGCQSLSLNALISAVIRLPRMVPSHGAALADARRNEPHAADGNDRFPVERFRNWGVKPRARERSLGRRKINLRRTGLPHPSSPGPPSKELI